MFTEAEQAEFAAIIEAAREELSGEEFDDVAYAEQANLTTENK